MVIEITIKIDDRKRIEKDFLLTEQSITDGDPAALLLLVDEFSNFIEQDVTEKENEQYGTHCSWRNINGSNR